MMSRKASSDEMLLCFLRQAVAGCATIHKTNGLPQHSNNIITIIASGPGLENVSIMLAILMPIIAKNIKKPPIKQENIKFQARAKQLYS